MTTRLLIAVCGFLSVLALGGWLEACSSTTGTAVPQDAAPDTMVADAGPEAAPDTGADVAADVTNTCPMGMIACGSSCVSFCQACDTGHFQCGGECVTGCDQCPAKNLACGNDCRATCDTCVDSQGHADKLDCFDCSGDAGRIGRCVFHGSDCAPALACSCATASSCPGDNSQVCSTTGCLPCGAAGTDMGACKNMTTCSVDAGACQ
jgi:hypothetical protein